MDRSEVTGCMASCSRSALQELHALLEPVLHYFREVAGQTLQPTSSINAFCWPISYLSESKMPAAVRVFEQTAKYSLRVTLLASAAYSGNKPVYTVMIQPNSSHESLCVMAQRRQFPLREIFIKNSIGERSFCAEMVEAVGLRVVHSVFCVHPSCRGWP